jgi:ubiquinone/menaquinone biosynthesis C-methylase UbiE
MVMDAGCGDGRNISPFLEQGFDVTGVDESRYALEICRKNYPDAKNLKLIQASLTSIPLPDESLDALICDHVITHIRDIGVVLANFHRLLRRGGYALLEFTSPQDSTYGQGQRISDNEFNQDGVYLRYDTPEDVWKMLSKFTIICFTPEHLSHPDHGPGYVRKGRHKHHSHFVIARKQGLLGYW